MWKFIVPVSLLFVVDIGEHEGYGVVDAINTAGGARVVRVGGSFIDDEAVAEDKGSLKQSFSPSSERRATGHPQRRMYRLKKMSAVPEAVN